MYQLSAARLYGDKMWADSSLIVNAAPVADLVNLLSVSLTYLIARPRPIDGER
jgi:hypothetical protein